MQNVVKYLLFVLSINLVGCTTSSTLHVDDLPSPSVIFPNDENQNGGSSGNLSGGNETNTDPGSENPYVNTLNPSDVDNMFRPSNGFSDKLHSYRLVNSGSAPSLTRSFNVGYFNFAPEGSVSEITYSGSGFVRTQYGFAEQETGEINNLNFANTKLVLGGGTTGLNYVDFGYWIGIPNNTEQPKYVAFATYSPHFSWKLKTPFANTSYTGKAAAIAVAPGTNDSARELGGDAILTLDASKNAHLSLSFQNYYTFDIYSNDYTGSNVTSVTVYGANTIDGPTFSSCVSDCDISASYGYVGGYEAVYPLTDIREALGTYKYTSGDSVLIGSFGTKKDD